MGELARKLRGRNPDWTRDETILLMNLYLSAPQGSESHPQVIALSVLLRAVACLSGRPMLPTFRNPAGIALRLRNFGRHDPDAPAGRDVGLKPGGAIDRLVWREFGSNREDLPASVAGVYRRFSEIAWDGRLARSSRGPTPTFGERTTFAADGQTGVYLLLVVGPIDVLAPKVVPDSRRATVKIGRTNDLERRIAELAYGLPPSATIRYIPIGLRMFATADEAHAFERHLLDLCDQRAWSLGGEFAYAAIDVLQSELASRDFSTLSGRRSEIYNRERGLPLNGGQGSAE